MNTTNNGWPFGFQPAACAMAVLPADALSVGGGLFALVEHLFALGLCRVRGAGQRRCGAAGKGHGRGCEPRDAALLERQTVRYSGNLYSNV